MKANAAWRLWPGIVVILLGARYPEPVRLGLLVPRGEPGLAARRGASMAVEAANRDGGFRGRPFELVVRSVEGPWGSGSKEIVDLVFEEHVWAILGPLDGRSAHLAVQVAVKGQVVLVSPWASDPTLTGANVPWFFRCVPDDRQQAAVLVREMFGARRLERVAVVAGDSYDALVAAEAFTAAAEDAGHSLAVRLPLARTAGNLDSLLNRLEDEGVQGVALFGPRTAAVEFIRRLRAGGMRQQLFAPLSMADRAFRGSERSELEQLVVVAPGHWVTVEGRAFQRAFRAAYDDAPTAVAAYAYDGMMVIVEAVRRAGLDRRRIRDALSEIDHRRGVTGRVRFDDRGNRVVEVELIEIAHR
jgi:branched-chain amino acid transport system substrate-binding protein